MLRIRPFSALRPRSSLVERVAAVPYDVVSTEEARALARDNPYSFLRVTRAELELDTDAAPYADAVYERARSNFERMQHDGIFQREASPSLYVYRQEMRVLGREVSQTGLVCTCHIDDYTHGIIRVHEKTRQVKEDDRTRHVLALQANAGPVFLMYREQERLSGLLQAATHEQPLYEFLAQDGVRHVVWRVQEARPYIEACQELASAYVADGHHRAASAVRAGAVRREQNPAHTGQEAYNWFLAALFPAQSLTILPYHRVVRDLNGLTPAAFLAKLRTYSSVEVAPGPAPQNPLRFAMYLERQWYHVTLNASASTDPVASLHYQLLSEHVLEPVLGIKDLRSDDRIDFVGGIRGPEELVRLVDRGDAAVAFAMDSTNVAQIMAVADARQLMPPKSTWFEPKLRSGILIHTLND